MDEGQNLAPSGISILMPARNADSTIPHAVNDLLQGMAQDDELLIVDDGSSDRTPVILREMMARDHRLRVVTTRGVGLVDALNLGLAEARHDWVARADADDRYPPGRLSLQRAAITPSVVLISGDYRVNSHGRDLGLIPTALGEPFVKLSLVNAQRIPHPGVMLYRHAVLAAGGYLHSEFPAEDLGLWSRLRSQGCFVGVPGLVVTWQMRKDSITHSRQREQREVTRRLLVSIRETLGKVSVDDVTSELARYGKDPHGAMRAILLLRDMRAAGLLAPLSPSAAEVARFLARHPATTTSSLGRLLIDRRARGRLRSV